MPKKAQEIHVATEINACSYTGITQKLQARNKIDMQMTSNVINKQIS